MPDVVTGLSLLLLFVALGQVIGWPAGRGGLTIGIAHTSVSVAYVAVVVQARLAGGTRDLEAAAADLYAPPWAVFAARDSASDGARAGLGLAARLHPVAR